MLVKKDMAAGITFNIKSKEYKYTLVDANKILLCCDRTLGTPQNWWP